MKKLSLLLLLSLFLQEVMATIGSSTISMTENNSSSLIIASGARTKRLNRNAESPSSSVTIPFSFSFDGSVYTNLFVGQDGWIKLGGSSASTQKSNDLSSNNSIPKIAPFWDDLTFAEDNNNGGAYTFVNGTAPSRVFVTEWIIKVPKDGSGVGKIQVALYESSNNIAFFYQGLNPSGSMYSSYSVGLGNHYSSPNNQASVTTSTTNLSSSVSFTSVNNNNSAKIPDTRSYLFTTGASTFVPSSNLTFTNISKTSMTVNYTGGTGPNHFVLCRATTTIGTNPTNSNSYNANTVYGSGTNLGSAYVVNNGTSTSFTVTGLTENTNYYFKVYEQTGTGSSATFNTTLILSGDQGTLTSPPTAPPVVSTVPPVTSHTTVNFNCNKGNGERRMVMCQKDNDVNSDPQDGHHYSASNRFGDGDQYENGYVVYDGTDNNFSISNLEGGAKYHFTVIEYNGNGSSCTYNSAQKIKTTSETNATPPTTAPSSGSFGEVSSDGVLLNFTKGDGARRIVICKKGSEVTENAQEGRKYHADSIFGNGDDFGSGKVVYDGTGSSCHIKHLEGNSTYHFAVIEYNGDNDKTSYDNDHKYKCNASTPKTDTDNDGVSDDEDEYPADQHKAYTVNYPAAGYGTLMYEDLWPGKGDYDFNDLVVDYRYKTITNANNNVVEVEYTFVTRAIGGSLHNGFAFQLDGINKNKITSITGSKATSASWISLNANGTEAGHPTNTNVLVVDDAYKLFTVPSGYSFVNTVPNAPNLGTDTTRITIKFLNNGVAPSGGTVSLSSFPNTVFNPYLIVGQDRGKEVHLINKVPTAKVNNAFFGTFDDKSNPGLGKYYSTENNLPWALNINTSVPYASERTDFSEAYNKFIEWAQSGGTLSPNWYLNLTGNRTNSKLIIR
ncbi:MAG: LruC domain-containing protein [Bacteroidia bacterium]